MNAVPLSEPSDVQNLTVVSVTTNSVSLKWSKPEGDSDFYLVHVTNMSGYSIKNQKCESEECTIKGLTPGNEYVFTVAAVVNENTEGVPANVSDYTSKCRTIHASLYHERTSLAMFPAANLTLLCAKL